MTSDLPMVDGPRPSIIWRNGERWILSDDGHSYLRLLDLAPNMERMWMMEHAKESPSDRISYQDE